MSVGMAFSGVDEIGFAGGFGAGARWFLTRGVGLGLEFDRLRSSPTVFRVTCESGAQGCSEKDVATETEADLTTFLLMVRGNGREWGGRLGIGRSAGVVRADGMVKETGQVVTTPPADDEAVPVAWRRGADGSVLVIELHRRLPIPGPFPVRLFAGLRQHRLKMKGCSLGEYSPFCGVKLLTQFEAGLNLGLWPEGSEDPR